MTILNKFLSTCFQIRDLTPEEKDHTLHLRAAQKYKDGLAVGVVLVLLCLLFNGDMPWPLIQYGMIVAGVLDMGFVVMAIAYNRLSKGVTVATIKDACGAVGLLAYGLGLCLTTYKTQVWEVTSGVLYVVIFTFDSLAILVSSLETCPSVYETRIQCVCLASTTTLASGGSGLKMQALERGMIRF